MKANAGRTEQYWLHWFLYWGHSLHS